MAEHNKLGADGEKAALAYLVNHGYTIRDTNWRMHHLELDIVAEKDGYLVVVEVKTRASRRFIEPAEAVNMAKMRRLINAAEGYVRWYGIDREIRFDVVEMVASPYGFEIHHIEDAFISPVW